MFSRQVIIFVACLLFLTGFSLAAPSKIQKRSVPVLSPLNNILNLHTLTSDLIEGTFTRGNRTIHFSSRPTGLTLSVLGIPLLSFSDFGSFLRIDLGDNCFLLGTATEIVNRVLDITGNLLGLTDNFSILNTLPGNLLGLTDNLPMFNNLLKGLPITKRAASEKRFTSLMKEVAQSVDIELLPHLSIELALMGIRGDVHLCVQPLHLTALRLLKLRPDLPIDNDLVSQANERLGLGSLTNGILPGGSTEGLCEIGKVCNNDCFGRCGDGCNCWSWVCGGCGCYLGCRQHDCCCSCMDSANICCANLAAVRCDGYANTCAVPGETSTSA